MVVDGDVNDRLNEKRIESLHHNLILITSSLVTQWKEDWKIQSLNICCSISLTSQWKEDWKLPTTTMFVVEGWLAPAQWKEDWKFTYCIASNTPITPPQWKEDWKLIFNPFSLDNLWKLNEKRIESRRSYYPLRYNSYLNSMKRGLKVLNPFFYFFANNLINSMKRGLKVRAGRSVSESVTLSELNEKRIERHTPAAPPRARQLFNSMKRGLKEFWHLTTPLSSVSPTSMKRGLKVLNLAPHIGQYSTISQWKEDWKGRIGFAWSFAHFSELNEKRIERYL